MLLDLILAAGCCLMSAGQPSHVAAASTTVPPADRSYEVRDTILMLENGPLHLRLNISLNGQALGDIREQYINRLITSLDTDGDGELSQAEADRSPLLRVNRRDKARQFLQSLGNHSLMDRKQIRRTVERIGGETVVYRQDESSASNDREVFRFLDTDQSGELDSQEMAAAGRRILERDQDRDQCVSFQEFLPPPEMPSGVVSLMRVDRRQRPKPTFADRIRDTQEPLLARRLIRQYDRDGDDRLDADELNWGPDRVQQLDRDGDRKLDARELAHIQRTTVDLEITVELAEGTEETPPLQVSAGPDARLQPSSQANSARVLLPNSVLTVSFREVDSIPVAIENAMRQFNALDVDQNGYLDRNETDDRIRFQRGLFEIMDADGDGKIFAEEMEAYVTVRAEPAAGTCRVHVYDIGNGYFQTLDKNGDGQISVREMRDAQRSLREMAQNRGGRLTPQNATRHFHLEFVRGSYQLFGPTDQMIARTPTFQPRTPVGPIWFQRMDRNNDGDLTWDEFLGPREVFNRLDADHDALIDPQEAAKVKGD